MKDKFNAPQGQGDGAYEGLSDEHARYLRVRAVSPDVARHAGLRSVDAEGVLKAIGMKPPVGGMVIPYPSTDYARVRFGNDRGSLPKDLAPAGVEVPVYVPPGVDDSGPLVVVESAV